MVVRRLDGDDDGIEDVRAVRAATAGESERIIGLLERNESDFPSLSNSINSCLGSRHLHVHVRLVLLVLLLLLVFALVLLLRSLVLLHMRMPQPCTVRAIQVVLEASCLCRGPPVTAWTYVARVPRAQGGSTVGFLFRPKICVLSQSGGRGKFSGRPAAFGSRLQVTFPEGQPGTGTRRSGGGAVTPFIHPEVPDSFFVSPGRGKAIRQAMDWKRVCGTAGSGIWVPKGDARARMLPDNLDHFLAGWMTRGTYETAWVTPLHDCLCSHAYGRGAVVRPPGMGATGLWCRVEPLLSSWCTRGNVPTGVKLNRYAGPRSCIPWHSDNEPLFGQQNQLKLIVRLSLGNSVDFQVRRVPRRVPSPIWLDHGDILVMDGLA